MDRPNPTEYGDFYRRYVDHVPEGNLAETMAAEYGTTRRLLDAIPPELERHSYGEGKWTVREVVGHLMDTERVFQDRALWIARQPGVELPGMDQEVWAKEGGHGERPVPDLLEEWDSVRASTLHLLTGLPDHVATRRGVASGTEVSVRALFWILAGHEIYHRIRLRDDYGLRE